MASLNKLIGPPVDIIIFYVREDGFKSLYATGDSTLISRIEKSPLDCKKRPSIFSKNVVSLTDCSMKETIDRNFEVTGIIFFLDYADDQNFKYSPSLPATLRILHCWLSSGLKILPSLTNLVELNLDQGIFDCYEGMFPPNLQKLTLPDPLNAYKYIPDSLTDLTLVCSAHYHLKGFDLSSSNLRKLVIQGAKKEVVAQLPTSLIYLRANTLSLDETHELPNLEEANVNEVNGIFPKLQELTCQKISFLNCPHSVKITRNIEQIMSSRRTMPVSVAFTYSGGVLRAKLLWTDEVIDEFPNLPLHTIELETELLDLKELPPVYMERILKWAPTLELIKFPPSPGCYNVPIGTYGGCAVENHPLTE